MKEENTQPWLPADYCRCNNETCPLRKRCWRWITRLDDNAREYAEFKPASDGKCLNMIEG